MRARMLLYGALVSLEKWRWCESREVKEKVNI